MHRGRDVHRIKSFEFQPVVPLLVAMSRHSPSSRKSFVSASSQAAELELFRRRWIENVDRIFSQFCVSSNDGFHHCRELELDDREVSKLKAEYDRLQREIAYSEREKRRAEFFEVLPIKTCNSHQLLHVRNERLATSLNDIELLFVVDSDNDSAFSDASLSRAVSISHCSDQQHVFHHSCRSHRSFVFKLTSFFKCW